MAHLRSMKYGTIMTPIQRFLRPSTNDSYEIFHQSFRDFLQCKLEDELSDYHDQLIGEIILWSSNEGWRRIYALAWLPTHLHETERIDDLKKLLLDLNFLEEKTIIFSISDTLRDFTLLRQKMTIFAC